MIRLFSEGGSQNPRIRSRVGLGIFVLGVLVAGTGIGYWVYAEQAALDLEQLVTVYSGNSTDVLPEEWLEAQTEDPVALAPARVLPASITDVPTRFHRQGSVAPSLPLFDWAEPPADSSNPLYRWTDWNALPRTFGNAPRPTRIVIPAIGMDSAVVEVGIIADGEGYVWQRPKQSTGYHAGTARPGERGNVVVSGHINSPVRGEGSVFNRLPEVPALVREGEAVEVFLYTEERTYVYRVVSNVVMDPDEVRAFASTAKPTLTLITCVPDRIFSHRLVVSALLVKLAEGGSPSLGQTTDGPVVAPLAQSGGLEQTAVP